MAKRAKRVMAKRAKRVEPRVAPNVECACQGCKQPAAVKANHLPVCSAHVDWALATMQGYINWRPVKGAADGQAVMRLPSGLQRDREDDD